MNEVLEIVSPNNSKWNFLTYYKSVMLQITPMQNYSSTINLQTKVERQLKIKEPARELSKMLRMHKVALICETHAERGGVAESRI